MMKICKMTFNIWMYYWAKAIQYLFFNRPINGTAMNLRSLPLASANGSRINNSCALAPSKEGRLNWCEIFQ